MAKVATYNAPHRLDPTGAKRRRDIIRLAQQGVTIIALQEVTDLDPRKLCPPGWTWHRPRKAASTAVLWKKAEWRVKTRGAYKLSSPGNPVAPRYIVWVHLINKRTRRHIRYGSIHLPAFKTSKPRNRKEFIHQEKRAARWLAGGKYRCLAGDFNANPTKGWLPNMERVGNVSQPLRVTGPMPGQRIDHVWRPKRRNKPKTLGTLKGCSDHKALIADA